MPLVYGVPDHLDLHPYKGISKYLEYYWSYVIYTKNCEKINIKEYLSPKNVFFTKNAFSQKNGNQLERTWHHMKAETLKKTCVKFEERRLNTLREN